MDLRQRILEAYLTHEGTWEEIACRFQVGVATVDRLVGRWMRFPGPGLTTEYRMASWPR